MNLDSKFDTEIFRKDHPQILAANRHLASIKPVRLAYNASGYKAGTVLAKNSVSGLFQAYNDAGSSGLNTATCILFEAVDVSSFADSSDSALARGIWGGEVFEDKLVGIDANGKTDLNGRSIVDSTGVNIFKF